MTTAQIQYFIVAAERLNFTAAAEQLYITQPSLSRQIAAIESELGARLFDRSNNVVTLTPAGKALYERLTVFYEEYQTIVKEVRDISSGTKGHLNFAILEDQYMNNPLIGEIRSLIQENSDCDITILRHDSRALFSGLMDGSIDAGLMLVYDEFPRFGFEYLDLDTAPVHLAVNRQLLKAPRSSLKANELLDLLENIPLAMVTQNQFPESLQNSLMKFAPFTGLKASSQVMLLPSTSSVSLYAATGLAVTLTNRGNLLANDPNIELIPVEGMGEITQGLVWRRGGQNPLLNQLVTALHTKYQFKLVQNSGG